MGMLDRLDDFRRQMGAANDLAAVGVALHQALPKLGFEHHVCSLVDPTSIMRRFLLTSYPGEWCDYYHEERLRRFDPVFQHAARSAQPALWSELRQRDRIEQADRLVFGPSAEFGIVDGGGLGVRGPAGQIVNLQVASGPSVRDFDRLFAGRLHELTLIALYTHHRVLQLRASDALPSPRLKPRQREVLVWAAHGKTNAEIGNRLGIKADTVRQHFRAASKMLGAVNRTHAVALALVQRLIEL